MAMLTHEIAAHLPNGQVGLGQRRLDAWQQQPPQQLLCMPAAPLRRALSNSIYRFRGIRRRRAVHHALERLNIARAEAQLRWRFWDGQGIEGQHKVFATQSHSTFTTQSHDTFTEPDF